MIKKVSRQKKRIILVSLYLKDRYKELALSYLKVYFSRYSEFSKLVDIKIQTFSIFDSNEAITFKLARLKPHMLGFSCYVWNIDKTLEIVRLLKRNFPYLKIVLGGPEVSAQAKNLLRAEPLIDAVVINEGEETFKELVDSWLNDSRDLSKIKGLCYRNNGNVIETPFRAQIQNLDTIPSPYLSGTIKVNKKDACLETMRGCTFSCRYCYYHKQFWGVRFFSMQRVKEELRYLLSKNIKIIYLMDPTFNLKIDRSKEILRFFIKHKKDSHLHVELKAELLDKELIELLSKAGVGFLEIGLQSTNRKALALVKRDFSPVRFKQNIGLLNKKKINYVIQIIEGLPGDNYSSFKKSINWVCSLKPPSIEIPKLMLLPGTYLRNYAKEFKIKYEKKAPHFVLQANTFGKEELERMDNLKFMLLYVFGNEFFKEVIYLLSDSLSRRFSDICVALDSWLSLNHPWAYSIFSELNKKSESEQGDGKLNKALNIVALIKLTGLFKEFAGFYYHKYGRVELPQILRKRIDIKADSFLRQLGAKQELV
ncbi:MAG: radical SAM protein [Candidatus Omnitrophota bacterium]